MFVAVSVCACGGVRTSVRVCVRTCAFSKASREGLECTFEGWRVFLTGRYEPGVPATLHGGAWQGNGEVWQGYDSGMASRAWEGSGREMERARQGSAEARG